MAGAGRQVLRGGFVGGARSGIRLRDSQRMVLPPATGNGIYAADRALKPKLSITHGGNLYQLEHQVVVTLRQRSPQTPSGSAWASGGWWVANQGAGGSDGNWNGAAPAGAFIDWTSIL